MESQRAPHFFHEAPARGNLRSQVQSRATQPVACGSALALQVALVPVVQRPHGIGKPGLEFRDRRNPLQLGSAKRLEGETLSQRVLLLGERVLSCARQNP